MEQNIRQLIIKLDNLLETKLENFLPFSDHTFEAIKKSLDDNKELFDSKIIQLHTVNDAHTVIDQEIKNIDKDLAKYFSDIDIYTLDGYKEFIRRVFDLCPVDEYQGYFLKEDSARKILTEVVPRGIMEFFSYNSLEDLFENIKPLDVLTISRYSENPNWQELYKKRLSECEKNDFEKRRVSYVVFDYKIFHKLLKNSGQPHKPWRLSHNKVSGTIMCFNINEENIFASPYILYISVFIHYFFETAFAGLYYSNTLSKYPEKIGSAVLNSFTNHDGKFVFFNPNVYSETLYWEKAINLMIKQFTNVDFSFFIDTIACGEFYNSTNRVSLNIVDHIWDVNIKEGPYLYHFEEAFWKNLFQEIINFSDSEFENEIIENLDMKDLEFTKYIIDNFNK